MDNETVPMKHIYVTQAFADDYEHATSSATQAELIKKIYRQQEISLETELSHLDEVTTRFKAACILQRSELQKVYDDQAQKLDEYIAKAWELTPRVKENAQRLAGELRPLTDVVTDLQVAIEQLNTLTLGVNTFGIDQILSLAGKLENLPQETKDIMQFMIASHSKMQLVK